MRIKPAFHILTIPALILSSNLASAGCVAPPASDQAISQFNSDPEAFIQPDMDTLTVELNTRDLVGTDATLAVKFVQIAKSAPPRFQRAIAAGLAQAAVACSTIDQQAALQVQQAVAGLADGEFQAEFAAVAGDVTTAATEAAAAYAAASEGSVVVTQHNSSPYPTPTQGGGGGTQTPVIFTAPAVSLLTTGKANTSSATSAEPVSATHP
jgi:hypothetical protein